MKQVRIILASPFVAAGICFLWLGLVISGYSCEWRNGVLGAVKK